jgi:DNA-binding MarR family transcriptional regulator
MVNADLRAASDRQIRDLAIFRSLVRNFLHFSEEAAARVGLAPQQHQLMLQIAGAPEGTVTTIGYLAEKLYLRHHSAVELSKRCEEAGLIVRRSNPDDRRQVIVELTATGNRVLRKLSAEHSRELNELGPHLIKALTDLVA